jgi:hypothetical protein
MSDSQRFALRPGTVPYRAIAYLQTLPIGTEVKGAMLAEAIGTTPASMNTCMEAARNAGLVFGRKRDAHRTSPVWWSLVDHTKQQTPQKGAYLDASKGQSHGAEGSENPNGRGSNAAPVLGAAPAFLERRGPVSVVLVDGCRAPESHAGACIARGQQGQTSLPASPMRIALWSDGTLQIERAGAAALVLSRPETLALVQYLDSIALDLAREGAWA